MENRLFLSMLQYASTDHHLPSAHRQAGAPLTCIKQPGEDMRGGNEGGCLAHMNKRTRGYVIFYVPVRCHLLLHVSVQASVCVMRIHDCT